MPVRTDADSVREVLIDQFDEDDSDATLTPFIKFANLLVTRHCATNDDYDEDYLLTIETWLAAHAYKVVKRQEIREEIGTVRVTYEGKVDLNLAVTEYGQQAMVLAPELAALNNSLQETKVRVQTGITYLGTPP